MTRPASPKGVRWARARGAAGRNRVALICALLAALLWQSLIVPTHIHLTTGVAAAAAKDTPSAAPWNGSDKPPLDSPANCPICREVAATGAAMLPAPVVLAIPFAIVFHPAAATWRRLRVQQRSHLWQSRAPPVSLQTTGM